MEMSLQKLSFMIIYFYLLGNLIFDSFKWWEDLVKKALEHANEFEMRLWEDDFEGIKSGQKFGKRVSNNQVLYKYTKNRCIIILQVF